MQRARRSPVTPEPIGFAFHPDIGTDGTQVVYSIGTGPKDTLELQNLQTGVIEQWTTCGDQYFHAELSGNGRYLAFMTLGPEGCSSKLVLT
ncbi:MAG: hypothetical protein R3C68_00545 [Myxococcota bacterium]